MKTAFVLGGGGSKGAYEIGVWKALREANISFDIVTGTSIGAMIGAMVVQDDFEKCYALWQTIGIDDVIDHGINLDFDIELLMSQKNRYRSLLESYVSNRGADISPFVELIDKMFDEQLFFSSTIDYACMSVNVTQRKPHPFTKDMMKEVDPRKAILASGSCFPAFPMLKIGDDNFIDGGYYDNVPIRLARGLGADKIIAVDLKSVGNNQIKKPQRDVLYIEPLLPLGSFLCFDHRIIMRNMQLGYQDCRKKLGKQSGYVYTFPLSDEVSIREYHERFSSYLKDFAKTDDNHLSKRLYEGAMKFQFESIRKEYKSFTYPYLRVLENCALIFEFDVLNVYEFNVFCANLVHCIATHVPVYEAFITKEIAIGELKKHLSSFSKKDIIYYFYSQLIQLEEATMNEIMALSLLFKESFLYASVLVFLANMLQKNKEDKF